MRKTLIALILVLPMAFVLVIFSSVNLVSLGVNIAVNGITIHAEGADDEDTLFLDMADKAVHTVTAEVSPNNATEKGYTLTSSDPSLVDVTKDGVIVPKKEGTVEITATSNDKSFTDTMSVVVVSSKPYDFDFSLFGEDGKNLLTETEDGYEATIPTGTYSYSMSILPMEFSDFTLKPATDLTLEIEPGQRTVFFPFTGDALFDVTVPDGVNGPIQKTVTLHVERAKRIGADGKQETAIALVNGAAVYTDPDSSSATIYESDAAGSVPLAFGTGHTRLFVECMGGKPPVTPLSNIAEVEVISAGSSNQYFIDVTFEENVDESAELTINVFNRRIPVAFAFSEFAFSVFADRTIETADTGERQVTLLTGNAVTFYAVASGGAKDVVYSWRFDGPQEYIQINGNTATVKVADSGNFHLTVSAKYGDAAPDPQTIAVAAIKKVSVVQIANSVKADLAANYTVAGLVYGDNFSISDNRFPLKVYTYSSASLVANLADGDILYSVSAPEVATIETDKTGAAPVLIPHGTGQVTVRAAWKGNAAFKANVVASLTLNVVKDAVAVKNAPELVKATEDGKSVALTENIKLGTDAAGTPFSLEQRNEYLKAHRFKSTYNIEWYKFASDANENDAFLSYVLEFKNDVYGNGKSIDADNFTHALDSQDIPLLELYQGPLYFVKYKQMASVAGQDNCAFLIRTNGVKLYGVNLLGCSDDSLLNADGVYDLTNLNLTGTTLEINADCEIINCRIRNGRNVVRAYGGNRNGNKYFIDSLAENAAGVDSERINVKIDGCILSQGREFILKLGANRALRASKANRQEPVLLDRSGRAYAENGNSNRYADGKLYEDPYFYSHYVLTDLTLKDSVLETSGLFTVGIESNFAGEFLYEGASDHQWRAFTREWERSGGTSFASVLRLEGDVRLYDWKDLALIDSSTLIESPVGALSEWLKLDIKGMLDFVSSAHPADYGNLIETTSDGKQYVHGGIALYGGGRNYSAVITGGLTPGLNNFLHINVNISVLSDAGGAMQQQGTLLPRAAGSHDFNFYMYGKNSANNYAKQRNDEQKGLKYKGVQPVSAF